MDFTEQIKNGVNWLDENFPGWEHEIDLEKLNLESSCSCILGQTSDYWWVLESQVAPEPLEGVFDTLERRSEWAEAHGFFQRDVDEYDELTDQWKVMVEKCRARESKDAVL